MSVIGIDLGTTYSLCGVFENGHPRLIANARGELLTPSMVGLTDDGHVLVGAAARDLRLSHPDRVAMCFKRWMGTDRTVRILGRRLSAVELSSLVLKSLVNDAEAELKVPITEAVITVPAYFNDHQRQATKAAGRLAGLNVRRIINEPTAAALAYGFHDRQVRKTVLVFDLGGGTFDVTLMEISHGTLEIVATAGESFLGGEDFTERLMSLSLSHHGLSLEDVEAKQPLRTVRLREECERAKRAMLDHDRLTIRLPYENGRIDKDSPVMVFSHADVARVVADLIDRLRGPLRAVLRDAQRQPTEVDEVILVGGATRMTMVRQLVQQELGRPLRDTLDADQAVALGAAVQTALMRDDASVADMVMTDVCPFTLGVEIVKFFGDQRREGYFLPVIHRNTVIPVSREEIVATVEHNQRALLVRIFQGESRRTEDNLLLGELRVDGLPPGKAGQCIHLRFTYDLNGLLEVEAHVPPTGEKFRTVLRNLVKGLSENDIESAIRNLQQLKFYPRDEAGNVELVRFAERVVGQLNPIQRRELESCVDRFESAMASANRNEFVAAQRDLVLILSRFGVPYDGERASDAEF